MTEQSLSSFLDSLEVVQGLQPQIRRWRESKGISQSEFANRLGVSPSYVNQVESMTRGASVDTLSNFYSVLAGGTITDAKIKE